MEYSYNYDVLDYRHGWWCFPSCLGVGASRREQEVLYISSMTQLVCRWRKIIGILYQLRGRASLSEESSIAARWYTRVDW